MPNQYFLMVDDDGLNFFSSTFHGKIHGVKVMAMDVADSDKIQLVATPKLQTNTEPTMVSEQKNNQVQDYIDALKIQANQQNDSM